VPLPKAEAGLVIAVDELVSMLSEDGLQVGEIEGAGEGTVVK
jgi:hypothetical protein